MSFTVEGMNEPYYFDMEHAQWRDWINSSYNRDGWIIVNDYDIQTSDGSSRLVGNISGDATILSSETHIGLMNQSYSFVENDNNGNDPHNGLPEGQW